MMDSIGLPLRMDTITIIHWWKSVCIPPSQETSPNVPSSVENDMQILFPLYIQTKRTFIVLPGWCRCPKFMPSIAVQGLVWGSINPS